MLWKWTIGRRLAGGFAGIMVLVGLMFLLMTWATRDIRSSQGELAGALRDASQVQVEAATVERWSADLQQTRSALAADLNLLRDAVLNNAPRAELFPAGRQEPLAVLLKGAALRDLQKAMPEASSTVRKLADAQQQLHAADERIRALWRPRHDGLAEALDDLKRTQLYWTLSIANMLFIRSSIGELLHENQTDTPFEEFRNGPVGRRYRASFPPLQAALQRIAPVNKKLWDASYKLAGLIMESNWEEARLLYRDVFPPAVKAMSVDLDQVLAAERQILHQQQQVVTLLNDRIKPASEQAFAALAELDAQLATLGAAKGAAVRGSANLILEREQAMAAKLTALQRGSLILTLVVMVLCAVLGWRITRGITRPLSLTVDMLRQLGAGQLDRRLGLTSRDELGDMARALDGFADQMRDEVLAAFDRLAAGDFTFRAAGPIRVPLQQANLALTRLVKRMRQAGHQVAAGAAQIARTSQELSQGTAQQSQALQDMSASLGETVAQARQNAERAARSTSLAAGLRDTARSGQEQMQDMVTAMTEVREAVQAIAGVMRLIDDIAFQTNLLALNASVEAARAGHHGKGFAVVADEVRNLAVRSAEAARETGSLIQDTLQKVALGVDSVADTDEALRHIGQGVVEVAALADEVALASQSQAEKVDDITRSVARIDQVIDRNVAGTAKAAAAAGELAAWAEQLHRMLGTFQLPDTVAEPAPAGNDADRHHRHRLSA